MHVGVTGATGYVGQFIVNHLLRNGCNVRVLSRFEQPETGCFDNDRVMQIEWHTAKLNESKKIQGFLSGLDAVVHAAFDHAEGKYRFGEGDDLSQFVQTNVYDSLDLMLMARNVGIQRFVFLSSRAVYAPKIPGYPLDENHLVQPETYYGAYKAAIEAFISAWGRQDDAHVCALRITGVYGLIKPLQKTKWYALIRAILNESPWDVARIGTEVHGEDVAKAVYLLLHDDTCKGQVINCSDSLISNREVAEIVQLLAAVNGPLPPVSGQTIDNVMDCGLLRSKGFEFGGYNRLEITIAEMIKAIRMERLC